MTATPVEPGKRAGGVVKVGALSTPLSEGLSTVGKFSIEVICWNLGFNTTEKVEPRTPLVGDIRAKTSENHEWISVRLVAIFKDADFQPAASRWQSAVGQERLWRVE
jgi:hypothetical protein